MLSKQFVAGVVLLQVVAAMVAICPVQCGGAPPYAYVYGSCLDEVNGIYALDGSLNGRIKYSMGIYSIAWRTIPSGTGWSLENNSGAQYFYNIQDLSIPPETSWDNGSGSAWNCNVPVVTFEPLPDKLFVSGSEEKSVNGPYSLEPETFRGMPCYSMGTKSINFGSNNLMQMSWIIGDKVTYDQYYYNLDIYAGAKVPGRSWYSGPSALMMHPPVVSEANLPNAYRVTGAGVDHVNGFYRRITAANGPVFEKDPSHYLAAGYYEMMHPGYGLTSAVSDVYYYVMTDDLFDLTVPTEGWKVGPFGGLTGIPAVYPVIVLTPVYDILH